MTLLSALTPAQVGADDLPSTPLVEVEDLSVTFRTRARHVEAVRGISFAVQPGQILAIVGESGSGKSVTARTLVGLAGDGAEVTATRLSIAGNDARGLSDAKWRALRGSTVGLVLQDALTSLDPLRTVGHEVGEVLRVKRLVSRKERSAAVLRHLDDVGMPETALRAQQYPHELSGGLRQRALIASGLAGAPDLLIADEPTTALDVTVQAQILDLLAQKRAEGTAILLISHDLAVVSQISDEVLVMHEGLVVESGRTAEVLGDPQHAVTRALLEAIPSAHSRGRRLTGGADASSTVPTSGVSSADASPVLARTDAWKQAPTVLEAHGVSRDFDLPGGGVRHAVADVNLTVRRGQKLGVVGESGSGKSTLARLLLGLLPVTAGEVTLAGRSWSSTSGRERLNLRRSIQFVSQDPHGSFDPRYTVGEVIAEPLRGTGTRAEIDSRITELLELVHLDPALTEVSPRTLSGGQRQRVSIARALALRPEIVVADEPVSALDVSIQAQILDLFSELVETTGTALVFISHDLGVVHHLVDTVAVMHDGRIVEEGDVEEVFSAPQHAYTRELLAAIPALPSTPVKGAP